MSAKKTEEDRVVPIVYAATCGGKNQHGYISDFNLDVASKIGDLVNSHHKCGNFGRA